MGTKWQILLFETSREEKPIAEFILKQQKTAKGKINHLVHLLEDYGPKLGMPHAKMLGNGIYELRIRGKKELRIFYCFKEQKVYLLHGFKKQSQKTPRKELGIAQKRMESLT